MKEKNKKILMGILEVFGYSGAIGYTTILTWLTYQVYKYGTIKISEPNIYIILTELGFGITTIGFLFYKFYKSLKKRERELIKL